MRILSAASAPTTLQLAIRAVQLVILLIALAVLSRRWHLRRTPATGWAIALFTVFALRVGTGFFPDTDDGSLLRRVYFVALLWCVLLIPYCILRVAHALGAVSNLGLRIATVLTLVQMVWTMSLPRLPQQGAPRSGWFTVYVILIMVSWSTESAFSAIGLWRASNGQPSIVRLRMRALSLGATVLAIGMVSGAGAVRLNPTAQTIRSLVSLTAIGLIALAFVLPGWLKAAWRAADLAEYGRAERALMTAVTPMQVALAIVPAAVRLFGADGAALLDADGTAIASHGLPPDTRAHVNDRLRPREAGTLVEVIDDGTVACRLSEGWLVVQFSIFAPLFDVVEVPTLERVASFVDLALHRCRLYEQEALSRHAAAVANAQLHQSQRLESIGQLAGGVAHDFNNLLAGIMTYAALVEDALETQSRRFDLEADEHFTTLTQDVGEITKVAARAAQLTHQLLILSRREVTKPEVLDLNAIVTDMEKLLRRSIGEQIELQVVSAPGLPRVKADRGQLEQVLMNLVVNARDSMPDGGTLRIETSGIQTDEEYARVRALTPGSYARLTISDTGTGMSREIATRAFEPFFTTKRTGEGTGLGLATVYGIAAQVGGDVAIYSEEGVGTTIRFILPATHEEVAADVRRPAESDLMAQGETILLVEDEDMVREPARRILQGHGYTVFAAANADEALEVAHQHPGELALLLTDVIMPGRSGKELAAEILMLSPHTEILYMSGYSADLIVHHGVLDDGVNLIEKPFPAQGLLRRVREILDGEPRVLQDR